MSTPGNSILVARWRPPWRAPPSVESLSVRDYFRCWLARFKLGAHLLDLSGLLFELRSENLHLFLLQGDSRFQVSDTGLLFLDFFVLFEELIEQQYGDRFVAHADDLPLGITRYPVEVYLGDFSGIKAKFGLFVLFGLPL